MTSRARTMAAVVLSFAASLGSTAYGQVLYSQDFQTDDTENWHINPGNPDLTNPATGPTTTATDIFFDYSTVGIPPAPNSSGGPTRGMKLQANIITDDPSYTGIFGGYSVSPKGQSFTGDYRLKFDLWSNYIGTYTEDLMSGGVAISADGASMLSTYGIMTSGTFSNSPGFADGVWFANTGDGGSGADYRIYSAERAISYQWPRTVEPNPGWVEDSHATYLADSRNNTAALYADNFGGATVPAEQTALTAYDYNGTTINLAETQYGTTPAGALGMAWHEVEIRKEGTLVTWLIDGIALGTVETAEFTTPVGGNNILFGHADINGGISTDPNYSAMMFTLIDNIVVEAITPGGDDDADFDNDGDVDGADFLVWQRGFGTAGDNSMGNANGDGAIDAADLSIWQAQFGSAPAGASISAVPEPTSVALALAGLVGAMAFARTRR